MGWWMCGGSLGWCICFGGELQVEQDEYPEPRRLPAAKRLVPGLKMKQVNDFEVRHDSIC